ncbi:hypothetical protein Tco_1199888 [Tanacetum coccineum]
MQTYKYNGFEKHDEEDKDEESFDLRVQTPSHYKPSDDEANDDLAQSGYAEEEEVNVEQTFEENINLEGRDVEMTDAPKTTQVIKDTHVTLTLVNPEGTDKSKITRKQSKTSKPGHENQEEYKAEASKAKALAKIPS